MEEPDWSDNRYPRIDYQDLSYYSAPKVSEKKQSLDEVGGWVGGGGGGGGAGGWGGRESMLWLGGWVARLQVADMAETAAGWERHRRAKQEAAACCPLVCPWLTARCSAALLPAACACLQVDPELLKTFDKLGIPLNEQKRLANVAVDAVFDSVSIATTFKAELAKASAAGRRGSTGQQGLPVVEGEAMLGGGGLPPAAASCSWRC